MDRDRRYGWGEDRDRWSREERWGRDRDERRGGIGREHEDERRARGGYVGGRSREDEWRSGSSGWGSRDWGGREDEWRSRDDGWYERSMSGRDEDWRGRDYGRDDEHGYGRMGLGERGGWGSSHATGGHGAGHRESGTTGMGLGSRTSSFGYGAGSSGYGSSGYGSSGYGSSGYGSSGYGSSGYGSSGYGMGSGMPGYGRGASGMGSMGGGYGSGGYGSGGYGSGGYGRGEHRDWERGASGWERDRGMMGGWDRDRDRTEREEGGFFQRMGEGIRNAFGMGDRDRERGPFFGKGPKGYKRSDERIREEVSEIIARQGWIDASEVEVKVQNGEVTLTGTISDREHKRRLEQMIEDVHGVDDVRNELRVRRSEMHTQTGTVGTYSTSTTSGGDSNEGGNRGRNARTS